MSGEFSGRHIVITGATGELGAVVARELLDAGATVHVPARDPRKVESRARAVLVPDLSDETAVAGFYAALPPLWASIHCAGGFAMSKIDDTSLSDFRKMFDMNTLSAFLCCREAVKAMRGRGGRIVNVASQQALEPRRGSGTAAYTASKAAVAAMTVAIAEEVAPEGIWVNAVVPSIMDTEANRRAMPKADHSNWPKLDEVAATIVFLASPGNAATRAALVPVYGKS